MRNRKTRKGSRGGGWSEGRHTGKEEEHERKGRSVNKKREEEETKEVGFVVNRVGRRP